MHERLKDQWNDAMPISEKEIGKPYSSGRLRMPGDRVLYAYLVDVKDIVLEDDINQTFQETFDYAPQVFKEKELLLITFHPDELGIIYELCVLDNKKNYIPYLQKIKND